MCRWMAWSGQPLLVEELLLQAAHGLTGPASAGAGR